MFLHLGGDVVIKTENIVGIFDLDSTSVSKWTRSFLSVSQKEGRIINVSYELPKSFIVTKENNSRFGSLTDAGNVYISQISAATLLKRLNSLEMEKPDFSSAAETEKE